MRLKDAKKFPCSLFLSFDSGTETFFIRSAPKLCVFLVLSVFIVPLRKLYILNFHCGSFFLYHRSCKMLFYIPVSQTVEVRRATFCLIWILTFPESPRSTFWKLFPGRVQLSFPFAIPYWLFRYWHTFQLLFQWFVKIGNHFQFWQKACVVLGATFVADSCPT